MHISRKQFSPLIWGACLGFRGNVPFSFWSLRVELAGTWTTSCTYISVRWLKIDETNPFQHILYTLLIFCCCFWWWSFILLLLFYQIKHKGVQRLEVIWAKSGKNGNISKFIPRTICWANLSANGSIFIASEEPANKWMTYILFKIHFRLHFAVCKWEIIF